MAFAVDRKTVPLGERLDRAVHGFQKIVAVRLDVEADEVGAQQAVHELALPGTDAEDFWIGPGDMPEDGHARVRARFLDHAREEGEVVVLREKDRRLRAFHLLEDGVGKTPVNLLVVIPILGPEDGAGVRDVAERPKTFVGESVVVALLFLAAQPHAAERVARTFRRHAQAIVSIHGLAVSASRAVGDPRAIASEQNRLESGDQAARRNDHVYGLVVFVAPDVHIRLAVGNHEQRFILKFVAQADAEPLGGPERSV